MKPRKQTAPPAEPEKVSPDVVYLPPKPFSRNRLILHLITLVAVVLAILLGISVFFKVEMVVVSGQSKYSVADVEKASGIQQGDNLLGLNRASVCGRIIANLPYVDSVRIGIKLPGTVNIEIVEIDVTYAVADQQGSWWLIGSSGKVVEKTQGEPGASHTRILGVNLEDPEVGKQAKAYQAGQVDVDENGNTIPITVTAGEKLMVAMKIATELEKNGIIGAARHLDVSNLFDIQIQYNTNLKILLGDREQLAEKIAFMKSAIKQQPELLDANTLDLSDLNDVAYK